MIAPGCIINAAGQVLVAASADPTPHHFSCGNPFGSSDRLIIATDPPPATALPAMWGIRRSVKGAMYGTTTLLPTDVFLGGLRVSRLGQIVYNAVVVPPNFQNGTPVDAQGALCADVI